MAQLTLPFPLEPSARFATFVPGGNGVLLRHVEALTRGGGSEPVALWIWGGSSAGKTHLLQAACAAAASSAIYLPLSDLRHTEPEILSGLESLELVALDDVDAIVGDSAWERELFKLFNAVHAEGGQLLFTAPRAPAGVNFSLPDLASRAAGAIVYQLARLGDTDRIVALQTHARFRGLDLPEASARFLLHHLPRDMAGLCRWLDRLDRASLVTQRKLTVPFIREAFATDSSASGRG